MKFRCNFFPLVKHEDVTEKKLHQKQEIKKEKYQMFIKKGWIK